MHRLHWFFVAIVLISIACIAPAGSGVRAQAPAPGPGDGIDRQCFEPSPTPAPTPGASEGCPEGKTVNVGNYIAPKCPSGQTTCSKAPTQSSAFPQGKSWAGNVNNQIVWISKTRFKQISNDKYILYEVDSKGGIHLIEDHTWENSQTCADDGAPAYQVAYDGTGNPGFEIAPATMTCNQEFITDGKTDAYSSASGEKCSNTETGAAGSYTNREKLIFAGSAMCNGEANVPMIAIETVSGAGAGEVFIYCNSPAKQGLCAWYERMDFSIPSNNPGNWSSMDICNGSLPSNIQFAGGACVLVESTANSEHKFPLPVQLIAGGLPQSAQEKIAGNTQHAQTGTAGRIVNIPSLEMYRRAQLGMTTASQTRFTRQVTSAAEPNQFSYSAVGRLCSPTSDTTKQVDATGVHIGTWLDGPELLEGSTKANGMLGTGKVKRSDLNFAARPDEQISVVPPCDSIDPGIKFQNAMSLAQGLHNYSDTKSSSGTLANSDVQGDTTADSHTFVYNWQTHIPQGILDDLSKADCGAEDPPSVCNYTQNQPLSIQHATLLSNAHYGKKAVGPQTVTNFETNKDTGWLNMWKPPSLKWQKRYATATNTYESTLSVLLGNFLMPLNFDDLGRWAEGFKNASCVSLSKHHQGVLGFAGCAMGTLASTALMPAAIAAQTAQTAAQAASAAVQTIIDRTPIGEVIRNTSKGRAPACVLAGIKLIETGAEWNPGNTCPINSCGAAGPFQTSVGAAPDPSSPTGYDTHCKKCGPDWEDGSRTCNNEWNGWPLDKTKPSPCSVVTQSAETLLDVLDTKIKYWGPLLVNATLALSDALPIQAQRDAIIIGGNSYYGVSTPIGRLENCSYGEYVYKQCDPSYVCGTHNIPFK